MTKGPTPICPNCGSAGVDHVEDELVCKRCKHTGTLGEFTKHVFYMENPDQIGTIAARRPGPHLSDEWDENEYRET